MHKAAENTMPALGIEPIDSAPTAKKKTCPGGDPRIAG
jgi:hypothetical protein